MTKLISINNRILQALALTGRESGQAVMEYAMLATFIAVVAMTILTVLGGIGGEAFGDLTAVFHGGGHETSVPGEAFTGYRIAD
jgi:Flp pilus assembly pilin Flp